MYIHKHLGVRTKPRYSKVSKNAWFTNSINTSTHPDRIRSHLAELGRQGVEPHTQKDGEQHHLEGGPNDTWLIEGQLRLEFRWFLSNNNGEGRLHIKLLFMIYVHHKQYANTIMCMLWCMPMVNPNNVPWNGGNCWKQALILPCIPGYSSVTNLISVHFFEFCLY